MHFPRDAVVGALMPASMILPAECPCSSPVPPSDSSCSSSVSDEEGLPDPPEAEERVSPNPWQDKKGEVQNWHYIYLETRDCFSNNLIDKCQ